MRLRVVWPALLALLIPLVLAAPPSLGQVPGAVTTRCQPCQALADATNDTIAQARLVAQQLNAAEKVLSDLEAEIAAQEAAKAEAEAEGSRLVTEREQKKVAGDTAGAAAADAAQQAAFGRAIAILKDIDFRLEPLRSPAQARIDRLLDDTVAMLRRMKEQMQQLAECEKQCKAAAPEERPSTGIPEPKVEPAPVDPDGFVTTDCALCKQVASDLNSVLRELIAKRAEVQSLAASIPGLEAAIEDAEFAERDALAEFRLQLSMEMDGRAGNEDARKAAPAKGAAAFEEAERARAIIDRLTAELEQARQRIEALNGEIGQLTEREAELRAALAECEKRCAEYEEAIERSSTGIPGGEGDPGLQPVTTDCPACEWIAALINDARGSIIAASQALAAAEAELAEAYRADDAARDDFDSATQELEDLVLEGEALRGAANPDAGAIAANDAAKSAASDKVGEAEKARSEVLVAERLARVHAIAERLVELRAMEADLLKQLEECEKQCAAPGPEDQSSTGIPEGGAEPATDFVTTDCPACERIVALLNDVIGSLKTLPGQIAEAQAALDEVKAKEAEIDSRRADAQARFEASLQEGENLRSNNPGDADGIATADTAKNEASAEVRAIEAELTLHRLLHVDPAQQKVDTLQKQFDEYKKLEAELRAQLAECEKQCKAAEEADDQLVTPGTTPQTASPFATTDCPACENIVSQLNDTIGTLMNLPGQIAEAQQALADAEAQAEENAEALAGATAALDAAIQAGETLRQSATPDADAIAEADAATRKASADLRRQMEAPGNYADVLAARQRLEALEAYLEQQKRREAELRVQLAECEKQCKAAEEAEDQLVTPGVTPEAASPFVKTDCLACEAIASLLNDTIGSLQNMPGQIAAARQALADAEAQAEENDEALAGAIAALDAAIQAGETLRKAATPDADAATRKASDDLRRQMEAPGTYADVLASRQRLEALEAYFEQLKALEAELRAELAECETQCQQAVAGPQSTPDLEPILDSGVITTDCPACEDLAAALNATAASLKAASEAMDEASGAYDDARRAGDKAMEGAGAALEAGGRYANDATLALNAGDQAAADAAVANQEEAFTEASELLDEADQRGLDAEAAKAALDDAIAKVNELRDLFNEQAKALEECEQQCQPVAPNLEVGVSLQDAACERGEECTIVISLTNRADQPHEGPGFISADMRFGVGVEGGLVGGAFCGWAPKGGSICSVPADQLEEGGTLTLVVPVEVPENAPDGSDFCAAVEMPEYGDANSVGAAIQLGLLEKGFPLGTIDGVIGPKSKAAIDGYLQAEDAPAGYADEGGESEEDPLDDDEPPSGTMPWTGSGMSEDEIAEMFGSVLPEDAARGYAELYRRLFDAPPPQRANPAFDPGPDCVPLGLPVLPKAAPRLPGDEDKDKPAPVRRNNAPGVTI
ncbi:MAG: hypothetical protein ACYC0C_16460, partial [Devosia sp.]